MKKLLVLFLCLAMFVALSACSGNQCDYDIKNYESKREGIPHASDFLPTLTQLGEYTKISYSYQFTPLLLFQVETVSLFVEYSPQMYQQMKDTLPETYYFLEKTVLCDDGASYQSAPASFTYKGYQFKTAVYPESQGGGYCKQFLMVGTDDEKCRLAFCYFYDMDLDYVGDADKTEEEVITKFMDEYFSWNDVE
ncbi:MAG: hypothetical protein E7447_08060 [Ruminococcaceae bacterium]|nr:hypothetical protein [Oscillospiraceae bacterium]